MSIPLDRLYHYIESIAKDDIVIYRFYPDGSKKAEDIKQLQTYSWTELVSLPEIYCNDQEPLNYSLYPDGDNILAHYKDLIFKNSIPIPTGFNFKKGFFNIYDRSLLLHSEQRSVEVEKYRAGQFIPVYYWSHALIALDWFRFAQYVRQKKQVKQTFLVYNRAWSGTREYRLKFAEYLVHLNLTGSCVMRVSPVDSTLGQHYKSHTFANPAWQPTTEIEQFFPECTADSHYSADFDINDYESTAIEVVLETLFDDSRLHLTEKILRPIALGQPFILAGTHQSLEYLRSYGFKTFADCWDESYDQETDPKKRLIQIAELMKYIDRRPTAEKQAILARAQAIADYNKRHFFSQAFFTQITSELKTNLSQALIELESTNTSHQFFHYNNLFLNNPELSNIVSGYLPDKTAADIASVNRLAEEYYTRSLK